MLSRSWDWFCGAPWREVGWSEGKTGPVPNIGQWHHILFWRRRLAEKEKPPMLDRGGASMTIRLDSFDIGGDILVPQ